ncbi:MULTISPECIES: hypothetical protein [unclassified Pedobacter]|uniref:hypothetical protein n=1 Tax=unclassified Pedobacter TaxID=2628915 RepID=UPI001D7126AE|nr:MULTISPECIES: hypothetical protein [unclassified Pedobacter]CAH0265559.1 hypothetical protein SRABI36_03587 [Pedobacter sp. Bi36]CAH0291967.1 hypothetical protein SRABI126_04081 [Pedobacter sp. Bi126]
MTSLELIERLIADIKNSQNVRGTKTLGMLSGMVFDTLLLPVSNMLTAHQTDLLLFDGKNLSAFLISLEDNKEAYAGHLQGILDDKNLKSNDQKYLPVLEMEQLGEFLLKRLDIVHTYLSHGG